MNHTVNAATLALALGTAMGIASVPATASEMHGQETSGNEKCYGVALKGQNDCMAGGGVTCSGSSKTDYQANAWKLVPAGTCTKMSSPTSPTGYGQLEAFEGTSA